MAYLATVSRMEFLKTIKAELPVVRQAPWAILSSVAVLTALTAGAIFWLFQGNLSRKNDLIVTLTGQVEALKREIESLKKAQLPTPSPASPETPKPSGAAPAKHLHTFVKEDRSVKIGDKNQFTNSPVITGDGNTVTVNPSTPKRRLTKEQADRLESLVKAIGPHEIAFRHPIGNEESQEFSDQLQEIIIGRAGWKLRVPKLLIQLREQYGVWVFVKDGNNAPVAATMLLDALNDKGVNLDSKGMEIVGLDPDTIDLMVGLQQKQ